MMNELARNLSYINRGQKSNKKELIINLLKLKSISDEEILQAACISLEELQKIKDEITTVV